MPPGIISVKDRAVGRSSAEGIGAWYVMVSLQTESTARNHTHLPLRSYTMTAQILHPFRKSYVSVKCVAGCCISGKYEKMGPENS